MASPVVERGFTLIRNLWSPSNNDTGLLIEGYIDSSNVTHPSIEQAMEAELKAQAAAAGETLDTAKLTSATKLVDLMNAYDALIAGKSYVKPDTLERVAFQMDKEYLKRTIERCLNFMATDDSAEETLYKILSSAERGSMSKEALLKEVMTLKKPDASGNRKSNAEIAEILADKYALRALPVVGGGASNPKVRELTIYQIKANDPTGTTPEGKAIAAEEAAVAEVDPAKITAARKATNDLIKDKVAANAELADAPAVLDNEVKKAKNRAELAKQASDIAAAIAAEEAKKAVEEAKKAAEADDGTKPNGALKLFTGFVDMGDADKSTKSALGRLKANIELGVATKIAIFGVDAEIDMHRAGYSPGQGEGNTNLFGPGSLGKTSPQNMGFYATGFAQLLEKQLTLKLGMNEIFWDIHGSPLQGFLSKTKLPGRIDYQLGGVAVYDTSPKFKKNDARLRLVGGVAVGALVDSYDMLSDLTFETGKVDKKWAKQLNTSVTVQAGDKLTSDSKKSTVAASTHIVVTGKDDDIATDVMVNFSVRGFLEKFSFGLDLRPYNSMALKAGQTENSHWSAAGEVGYNWAPVTIKLSAGHYSGTIARTIFPDSDGLPGMGTPESATTNTSLTDISLGVAVAAGEYGTISAQISKDWTPAGDGYAGYLLLALKTSKD